jgi:hypothetical protein
MFKKKYEYEVVKFHNGKYGVRRTSFFGRVHRYMDFKSDIIFWWRITSMWVKDCMVDDMDIAVTACQSFYKPLVEVIPITRGK